jgi:N-sulfoglucosamine sulfohydrolase
MKALLVPALAAALPLLSAATNPLRDPERLNVLVITADDMSCDSVGVYGCRLKDTTPNMDRLAAASLRFNHAFVQVGNCMPSRNVMFSGRFPHNNGVEGFYQVRNTYPVMADLMKAAGYYTGIRHKVTHSTPWSPYPAWDVVLDTQPDGAQLDQKKPASYHISTQRGIAEARKAGKPFCLNVNISDPHKPFYGESGRMDENRPSRVFTATEVPVPGFLFDDPEVRKELALYYSSVRRADDSLGEVLRALRESGEEERTVIFFLSDHGMPLPFAKTQLYFHSTRTPWMVRWPGVTRAGAVDDRHLISAVDLLPTLLDITGLPHPAGMDGRSFAPVLRGEIQSGRDYIVAEYNENSGGNRHPMRSIITRDHGYLFNPWSNGTRAMATATKGTVTYRRMVALAKTDAAINARLRLFDHRLPEEMYDYTNDPDALRNLIDEPAHRTKRDELIAALDAWMVRTKDPMLPVFRDRANLATREAFMREQEKEAAERNAPKRAGKAGKRKGKSGDEEP